LNYIRKQITEIKTLIHPKEYTKNIVFNILSSFKPVALAVLIIVFLQLTGLMSSVSYYSNWAVLQTGLKDASAGSDPVVEKFDYTFTIKDLNDNKINVEQFKGKVIFLNLWATWCGPCRAEMEGIQNLYSKIDKEKVVFIILSLDKEKDKSKIVDYIKKKGFTFSAYQPSGDLPDQLQVPSIPTTFIISKNGMIVRKEVGGMRYDTSKFQKFIEELSAN